jgi:hypothetical protein
MSSNFTLSCANQRKQRSRFFYHEAGDNASRFSVVSPYVYNTTTNQLNYSQDDLNMRRKAEILKYNSNDHKSNNKKANYAFLSKKTKKTITCPDDTRPKPSSSSGVPGQITLLNEDVNVPLYNYKPDLQQFRFQNIPYDSFKRIFDSFPFYNTITANNSQINLMDLIVLNPDNNQFNFNFSIPICLQFTADCVAVSSVSDILSAQINLASSILDIFYSDTLISSVEVPYRSIPQVSSDIVLSTDSISIDFSQSTTNTVSFSQYIGNIIINNVTIKTVTQYVYTLLMKSNISYGEYSGDNAIIEPIRINNNGDNITNLNSRNITNVSYNFITNFDNYDPTIFSSNDNCTTTVVNEIGEIIDKSTKQFTPFNLTATPV